MSKYQQLTQIRIGKTHLHLVNCSISQKEVEIFSKGLKGLISLGLGTFVIYLSANDNLDISAVAVIGKGFKKLFNLQISKCSLTKAITQILVMKESGL